MKYFEFGKDNKKTLLLMHGMISTWELSFKELIDLAEEEYHVIAIATDGYNPYEPDSVWTTTAAEIKKDADWLVEHFDGNIDICYGASQGGLFMTGILCDERINVHTAIFDGFAIPHIPMLFRGPVHKPLAKLMTNITYNIINKHPKWMVKPVGLHNVEELDSLMYRGFSKESLYNNMVEMLTYRLTPDRFAGFNKTDTYIFNGSKEKGAIKSAQKLINDGFKITIKVLDDLGHGSLLKDPKRLLHEINLAYKGYK